VSRNGLHILPYLGRDATLCATSPRTGRVETTDLYKRLYEAAGDIKPINISIDTLSRAFAGNEIDRSQVYAFSQHMQALAEVADGSVTILSHPSLAGIASGSGISGSTAWHGAFRFRHYLKGTKAENGDSPTTTSANWSSKKTSTDRLPRTSSYVIAMVCSFPSVARRTLRKPHMRPRPTPRSSISSSGSPKRGATSAINQTRRPTLLRPLPRSRKQRSPIYGKPTSMALCGVCLPAAGFTSKTTADHHDLIPDWPSNRNVQLPVQLACNCV
jgi:hypothetical protein